MRCRVGPARPSLVGAGLTLALLLPLALALLPCAAQQVHRNSFETLNLSWAKSSADVAYDETAHVMTDQGPHDGQRAEYIQINARQGSHVHYQYPTGRAPISEDLNVGLWVKANRPGIQLLVRVVLPNERDPNSLQDRLTTVLRGDLYRGPPGRWKRLELGRAVQLARQQQQLMQAQLGRPVNFTDAYVDAVLLNVYGGPGATEVWIDGLEIGPVFDRRAEGHGTKGEGGAVGRDPGGVPFAPQPAPRRAAVVEFSSDAHLLVNGRRFLFRGIRHTDTPVNVLRDAGFNTVFCDHNADPAVLRQCAKLGFWLVPHLPVTSETFLASADGVGREVRRFSEPDSVLFWNLGNALAYEQTALVSRSAQSLRTSDPLRPLGVGAWDGLARYSNSVNLVGVHRWPLMTTLELTQYRDWLDQRRRLANPGTFLWTWVQTHTPEFYTTLLYDRAATAAFPEPIGPQPEQIRLLAYTALGTGCRGVGYWSDRFLADSHHGRDRLLEVALLNQEMEMLEPVLLGVDSAPAWIPTNAPDVQAAVLRSPHGVLVLPMWLGGGSQFVPGQSAVRALQVTVPHVPPGAQAWEVTPGEVRALHPERVPGGMRITLQDFGLTAAVLFTADTQLIVRLQGQARGDRREAAARYTYERAVHELEKTVRVHDQLARQELTVVDAGPLLQDARDRLQRAKEYWDQRLYADAYRESERSMRPVRILMRALWDKATRGLDTAVSSPYAVSFYTLPRHLAFMQQLRQTTPAANALPGGDFEMMPGRAQEAWVPQDVTLDGVELYAERVAQISVFPPRPRKPAGKAAPQAVQTVKYPTMGGGADDAKEPPRQPVPWGAAREGKYCLKLEIRPKDRTVPPPLALDRTFLAINSPTVRLPPGSLVRISAWVAVPEPITASPDGAMLYDSAGGEPLAVRLTAPTPGGWNRITLYRKVPASGTINVTVALTGIGAAYFDDVRIEPLVPTPNAPEYVQTGAR